MTLLTFPGPKAVGVLSLLFCLFFSSHKPACAESTATLSPIVIERLETDTPHEIAFTVSVVNDHGTPLELKTEHGEVSSYHLGQFNSKEQHESVFLQSKIVIQAGEKKVVRYFKHDLEKFPSPDAQKATVTVVVKGVGEVTHEFELEKPGFLQNLMKGILGTKAKEQGTGDMEGLGADPRVRPEQEQGAHMGAPLRTATQEPGPVFEQQQQTVVPPVSPEPPVNQTPSSTTPPQTEPEVQTPEQESDFEESSSPVLSPTSQAPLDTTPPAVPSVNSLPQAVNATSVILSGAKDLNSSIWVNGIERIAVNNSTTWNFDMSLAEGANLLRVESKDSAGNVSSATTVSVIRDTTAPILESLSVSQVTTTSATIQIQASEAVSVTVTYQAQGSANVESRQSLSGIRSASHSITLSPLSPDTPYDFFVEGVDQVNQKATSPSDSFSTDTDALSYDSGTLLEDFWSHEQFITNMQGIGLHSLGDLNGDGVDEVGTDIYNADPIQYQNFSTFQVAYSSADGTYQPGDILETPEGFKALEAAYHPIRQSFSLGDWNADGYGDLFFVGADGGQINLLFSNFDNGKAAYKLQEQVSTSGIIQGLPGNNYYYRGVDADFNQDGIRDLLIIQYLPPQWPIIIKNYLILYSDPVTQTYDRNLATPIFQLSSHADEIETVRTFSDMNGDGIPELIAIHPSTTQTRFQFFFSPNFEVQDSVQTALEGHFILLGPGGFNGQKIIEAGDWDGDGIESLYGRRTLPGQSAVPVILDFNPDGSLKETLPMPQVIQSAAQVRQIKDLNGDGAPELAFVMKTNISIYLSKNRRIDFNANPDIQIFPDPNWVVADWLDRFGYVTVRPRIEGGTVKQDLLLKACAPGHFAPLITCSKSATVLYKQD